MKNHSRIILDLCGGTGSWSKPYREAGYDVRLITLPDNDVRTFTFESDVHGILAAPPCTEFSMAKHFHGTGKYIHDFQAGLEIVVACLRVVGMTRPHWWALENPQGYLSRFMGKPQWQFSPWQYGDNYQKQTCLWGRFSAPVPSCNDKPSDLKKFCDLLNKDIHPEYLGKFSRQVRRAITPAGFANAFFKANP